MIKHHRLQPVKPTRVVILGASGFIARDLIRTLAEMGVPTEPVGSTRVNLLDPASPGLLKQIIQPTDEVVITSALTPEKGRDTNTFMKNLAMMHNVCLFLEANPCSQVIYLSSDAAYEDAATLVRETVVRGPGNLYGMMHAAREVMLQYAVAKSKTPLCVVRPCAVYGAGDTHNSYGPNRFIRTALKDGKITLFGNGEEQRDHVYIKDVTKLISLCLMHKSEGAINAASGKAISFYELAEKIVALAGRPVQIDCLPRATPITHRHYDIALGLEQFPQFHPTSLDEGLAETVSGMKQ